jgi:hypothetical protein
VVTVVVQTLTERWKFAVSSLANVVNVQKTSVALHILHHIVKLLMDVLHVVLTLSRVVVSATSVAISTHRHISERNCFVVEDQ